jgi:hypothetical protein
MLFADDAAVDDNDDDDDDDGKSLFKSRVFFLVLHKDKIIILSANNSN